MKSYPLTTYTRIDLTIFSTSPKTTFRASRPDLFIPSKPPESTQLSCYDLSPGEMLLSPLDVVQDMFYGLIGSILYFTCAGKVLTCRLLDSGYPRTGDVTSAVAMGGLAVACAVVMLLDMCLAYVDSEVYDEEGSV